MSFTVHIHHKATGILAAVEDVFRQNPHSSNIMYAHAVKTAATDNGQAPNLWIIAWYRNQHDSASSVAFVLSCTTGPFGPYPIFIFTPLSNVHLQEDFVRPGILAVIGALRNQVPPERVFSVFAVDALADAFAAAWTAETGVQLESTEDPVYYHAALMHCNLSTFHAHAREVPFPAVNAGTTFSLRPAVDADLPKAAALCHGFAAESEPFVLSCEKAATEARILIENQQLWVHEIRPAGQEPEVASIVAITRVTETVAGITKVYTNPKWRKLGCAERLMRHVCEHLLKTRESVVLYVGHRNPSGRVYGRVGFESLVPGVTDSWKELGFDRSKVDLGHW